MLKTCILPIGALFILTTISDAQKITKTPLISIDYAVLAPYTMNMSDTREIAMKVNFNEVLLSTKGINMIKIFFKTETQTPQFEILELDEKSRVINVTRKQLEKSKYSPEINLWMHASYIGHAILKPVGLEYQGSNETVSILLNDTRHMELNVVIKQFEGIWGTIFIVSVSALIIVNYINLGSQLDTENIQQMMTKPKTIILGFLITVFVMPVISWLIGQWFLKDQLLYRIGSFIFACGPTATASTLWTVMLDSDKELSVGLQVASTLGALATMPVLLFWMETGLQQEGADYSIKVPYARLVQTLLVLLLSLFVGWRFVGHNARAQKISGIIFRPLTFFVLIFIIVFSSILYWHIYRMFDWNITLASFVVTMLTYVATGILGYLINCKCEHVVPISIASAYKNSGIAFAVLLVAFGSPDTYIAYVPCLTQVVTTSISLYLTYCLLILVKFIQRLSQPEPIQAETEEPVETKPKEVRSGSGSTNKSERDEENDEFIAMNVTDVMPDSPTNLKTSKPVG